MFDKKGKMCNIILYIFNCSMFFRKSKKKERPEIKESFSRLQSDYNTQNFAKFFRNSSSRIFFPSNYR